MSSCGGDMQETPQRGESKSQNLHVDLMVIHGDPAVIFVTLA